MVTEQMLLDEGRKQGLAYRPGGGVDAPGDADGSFSRSHRSRDLASAIPSQLPSGWAKTAVRPRPTPRPTENAVFGVTQQGSRDFSRPRTSPDAEAVLSTEALASRLFESTENDGTSILDELASRLVDDDDALVDLCIRLLNERSGVVVDRAVLALEDLQVRSPERRATLAEALATYSKIRADTPSQSLWSALRKFASLVHNTKLSYFDTFLAAERPTSTRQVALQCWRHVLVADPVLKSPAREFLRQRTQEMIIAFSHPDCLGNGPQDALAATVFATGFLLDIRSNSELAGTVRSLRRRHIVHAVAGELDVMATEIDAEEHAKLRTRLLEGRQLLLQG